MNRTVVATLASIPAVLPSIYLGVLTAVALIKSAASSRIAPLSSCGTRFVICVPAHNEAGVIHDTVGALRQQNYPPERFSVHVVADNCSDDTAAVASSAGAIVHVRDDPDRPGKGPALSWLQQQLEPTFDVLVIIDADTVADPRFLHAMDRAFTSNGAQAAQGYYGVRNPGGSSAAAFRSAALACRHHLRPLARTSIGGSCGLYGNGMAFKAELLTHRRWSDHLVEDAEFQTELLLSGIRVDYVPDAQVWAEMPDSFEAAASQNERWELGRLQLARRSVPKLLGQALQHSPASRVASLDAVADHLTPPLSVLAAIDLMTISAGGTAMLVNPSRNGKTVLAAGVLSSIVLTAHVFIGLKLVHAPSSVYRSLISAPKAVLWKMALLARVAHRPEQVAWTRTRRNATVASTS